MRSLQLSLNPAAALASCMTTTAKTRDRFVLIYNSPTYLIPWIYENKIENECSLNKEITKKQYSIIERQFCGNFCNSV